MTTDDVPFGIYPRHVLCVVGISLDFAQLQDIAETTGGPGFTVDPQYSLHQPDPDMDTAFQASLTSSSFSQADVEAVASHDSVAYLMSPPLRPGTEIDISARMLAVTAALLRDGAGAAKNESSMLTHGRTKWLALADRAAAATDHEELAAALYEAWVKRPILSDEVLLSCGMHLLGQPDVELETEDLANPALINDRVVVMDTLAIYLLTEERSQHIADGEGFRLAIDAPRWLLHRHDCHRFETDDLSFNPAGYWRLTPE